MPIATSDVKFRLSGGVANTNPLLSIGGDASTTTDAPAGIFDDVSSAEATAGDVEYRCVYVKNTHATLTLIGAAVWIQAQTPSAMTDVAIGLGASAINGSETAVANENTAPGSVTFSQPASFAAGLVIGDLAPGAHKAVWVRRTVSSFAPSAADGFTLRVQGDTNP